MGRAIMKDVGRDQGFLAMSVAIPAGAQPAWCLFSKRRAALFLILGMVGGICWGQCTLGIETVAGLRWLGDGGPATSARLNYPYAVAVDTAGNVYIADTYHHRIRKVTPSGTITTVAGTGNAGYSGDGGPAIHAQLNFPQDIAVDSAGNLYIADSNNHRIRKVTPLGVILTVAGTGILGFSGDGGLATAARLAYPTGVAVDSSGNLYVADRSNYRIRKVQPTGMITTVAGNGTGSYSGDGGDAVNAGLWPADVAVDSSGNLYIADLNSRIRKVNTSGQITTVAGNGTCCFSGDGRPATEAQLQYPNGVAVDEIGNIYIADANNARIRRVDTNGIITTVAGGGAGSGDNVLATTVFLDWPGGVALDNAGNLYIASTWNLKVRKVDTSGIITTVAGIGEGYSGDGGSATSARLSRPEDVAVDTLGNIYIADTLNGRIRKVTSFGAITTVAGGGANYPGDGGAATAAVLGLPRGVTSDSAGNLYIVEPGRVRKVDSNGFITTVAGTGNLGYSGDGGPAIQAELKWAQGIAVDSAGNLYIADRENHRIRKVSPAGIITTVVGNGTPGFSGDGGQAVNAQLNSPDDLAVDHARNLYIVDSSNQRIRKVDSSGVITTVAGNGIATSGGDGGLATAASLYYPRSVTVDILGNLYISEQFGNRIRKVTPSGVITTVAGMGTWGGYSGDGGLPTSAQLYYPFGLVVDNAGNLYFTEQRNHIVRRVRLNCLPEPAVVYRDSNSGIRAVRGTTGTEYQLGGLFGGDPGVGVDGGGRLVVAARDTYNSLWAGVIDVRNGQWSGWAFGGGLFQGQPAVGVVSNTTGSTAWIAVGGNWHS